MPVDRQGTNNPARAVLLGITDEGIYYFLAADSAGALLVNIADRALRDLGKVDVALIDFLIAHDAVNSGNYPFLQGAHALAHGAAPTPVAAGDVTQLYANRHGVPWVMGGHPNVQTIRATYSSAQADVAVIAAVGAGAKPVITRISAKLGKAYSGTGAAIRLGFGAAATPTTTGVVASHPGVAAGGGMVEGNGGGILGVGADGDGLFVTAADPTGLCLRSPSRLKSRRAASKVGMQSVTNRPSIRGCRLGGSSTPFSLAPSDRRPARGLWPSALSAAFSPSGIGRPDNGLRRTNSFDTTASLTISLFNCTCCISRCALSRPLIFTLSASTCLRTWQQGFCKSSPESVNVSRLRHGFRGSRRRSMARC